LQSPDFRLQTPVSRLPSNDSFLLSQNNHRIAAFFQCLDSLFLHLLNLMADET